MTTSVASVRKQARHSARQTKPKDSTSAKPADMPQPLPSVETKALNRTRLTSSECRAYRTFFSQGLKVLTETEVRQLRHNGYKVFMIKKLPSPTMPVSPCRSLNAERIKTRVRRKAYSSSCDTNDDNDEDTPGCPSGVHDGSPHQKTSSANVPSTTPSKRSKQKEKPEKIWLTIAYLEDNLRQLIKNLIEGDNAGINNMSLFSDLFRDGILKQDLTNCFHQIYDHFYGKDRPEMLRGQYTKDIDLVALLYVLVNDYKLGSEKLAVKPFHTFIKTAVFTRLKPCHRTLHNRLNFQFKSLMDCAKTRQGIPYKKWKPKGQEEENYAQVRAFFCNTQFYKDYKNLLKKIC